MYLKLPSQSLKIATDKQGKKRRREGGGVKGRGEGGGGSPVMRMTVGVMRAATPQPNFLKITRESSIMTKVTAPADSDL